MNINPVAMYLPVNNYGVNKSKANNNQKVSFNGIKEDYCIQFAKKVDIPFSNYASRANDTHIANFINNLLNIFDHFPEYSKSKDYSVISRGLVNITTEKIKKLSDTLNLKVGEYRDIVNLGGMSYLIVANLGPYDKGLFSTTDHDEIIFEFKNPEKDDFIGFSLDVDRDLAVTRPHSRTVFYDTNDEKIYKGTLVGGYKSTTYNDFRNKDGSTPQPSFFDWF